MKKAEIIAKLEARETIQLADYLMSVASKVEYKNKTTGKPDSFDKLVHTVLVASGAATVDEDTRSIPNFSAATYKSPFKQGDRVAVIVDSKSSVKGVVAFRGKLLSVES